MLWISLMIQRIHVETLHGGVSLTMAAIHEQYWIQARP